MQRITQRGATAALAFLLGLASARLAGPPVAPAERLAEWLAPADDTSALLRPVDRRDEWDAREVYETVLRELFGGGDPGRFIAVRSETVAYPFTEGHARYFQTVSAEALADYTRQRLVPKRLPPLDGLEARATLLDWDEPAAIRFRPRRSIRWEFFRGRFPNVRAYVELTPVGFNRAGDEAFLHAALNRAGPRGEGWLLLLRKGPGGWEIVDNQGAGVP